MPVQNCLLGAENVYDVLSQNLRKAKRISHIHECGLITRPEVPKNEPITMALRNAAHKDKRSASTDEISCCAHWNSSRPPGSKGSTIIRPHNTRVYAHRTHADKNCETQTRSACQRYQVSARNAHADVKRKCSLGNYDQTWQCRQQLSYFLCPFLFRRKRNKNDNNDRRRVPYVHIRSIYTIVYTYI